MRISKEKNFARQTAALFRTLGQPARLEILLAVGMHEACVCHLEAVLKMRQAYLSQHLMALRQAGVLDTRKEGRFVFYRLVTPQLLDLILLAAQSAGISVDKLVFDNQEHRHAGCCCPQCAPVSVDGLIQLNLSKTSS